VAGWDGRQRGCVVDCGAWSSASEVARVAACLEQALVLGVVRRVVSGFAHGQAMASICCAVAASASPAAVSAVVAACSSCALRSTMV
jgi:hypothetical protein